MWPLLSAVAASVRSRCVANAVSGEAMDFGDGSGAVSAVCAARCGAAGCSWPHAATMQASRMAQVWNGWRTDARRESGFAADRSEEHTSELQSLMRISYAVFC